MAKALSYKSSVDADREPVEFEIDGEKFVALAPPGAATLFLAGRISRGDADSISALLDWFEKSVGESAYKRFIKAASNLEAEDLLKIWQDLMEAFGERPTES